VTAQAGVIDVVNRKHARHTAELRVEIETRDALLGFVTENISRGGMFIRTDLQLSDGTSVRVNVVHPDSQALFPLDCIVRRRVFGTDAGLGLEFTNMTERTRAELVAFLSSVVTLDDELAIDIDTTEIDTTGLDAVQGSTGPGSTILPARVA
jgi:c-di-GMP-binding flagellar brake protein YcgR